jgi:hypothetical protein
VGPRAGLDRCGKSRLHRDSIPDLPARSQSLYRLRYPAHSEFIRVHKMVNFKRSSLQPNASVRFYNSAVGTDSKKITWSNEAIFEPFK